MKNSWKKFVYAKKAVSEMLAYLQLRCPKTNSSTSIINVYAPHMGRPEQEGTGVLRAFVQTLSRAQIGQHRGIYLRRLLTRKLVLVMALSRLSAIATGTLFANFCTENATKCRHPARHTATWQMKSKKVDAKGKPIIYYIHFVCASLRFDWFV